MSCRRVARTRRPTSGPADVARHVPQARVGDRRQARVCTGLRSARRAGDHVHFGLARRGFRITGEERLDAAGPDPGARRRVRTEHPERSPHVTNPFASGSLDLEDVARFVGGHRCFQQRHGSHQVLAQGRADAVARRRPQSSWPRQPSPLCQRLPIPTRQNGGQPTVDREGFDGDHRVTSVGVKLPSMTMPAHANQTIEPSPKTMATSDSPGNKVTRPTALVATRRRSARRSRCYFVAESGDPGVNRRGASIRSIMRFTGRRSCPRGTIRSDVRPESR